VAAFGFLLAELASLHHQAEASACLELGERAHADVPGAADRVGDAQAFAHIDAVDPLAAGELAHGLCHLCRSSRERFAAPASGTIYAAARADQGAASPSTYAGIRIGAAIYTVAPKTSPPA
jgi:hypothetical protein